MKIEFENVNLKLGGKHIINNFNYVFSSGTSYGIFGTSGSGKTTILNLISGIVEPTSGKIIVDGIQLEKINSRSNKKVRREYINYIFQNFALVEDESIYENLKIVSTDKIKMKDALSAVHLNNSLDSLIYTLSGGEQQRIAIARSNLRDTPIILADEPTGNLDQVNGEQVCDLLLSDKKNKIVIIVSHDENVVSKCGEVININNVENKIL